MKGTTRCQHLFIIRSWFEPGQAEGGQWRCSIEHVPTGRRLYSVSLADLTGFMALILEETTPSRQSESKELLSGGGF